MEVNDQVRIKEIGSSDDEVFDDSLESDTTYSVTPPTDGDRDNESGSDTFGRTSTLEEAEMHLSLSKAQYLANDWSEVVASAASGSIQEVSQYSEQENLLKEQENVDRPKDENEDISLKGDETPCCYKSESDSELEQLSYSDRSSTNTPVTSAMSGFTPIIKSSALILLKSSRNKKRHGKKNSKKKINIDANKNKKETLLSRVQLDDDTSEGNWTNTTPQIDVTESDSPSPRKLRKPHEVKSKRKESRPFISPIAVHKSSQFITHVSGSSRSSHCTDRLGGASTTVTDSTESFKRNELAMSSCVTTPREFTDQLAAASDDGEEEEEEEEKEKEETKVDDEDKREDENDVHDQDSNQNESSDSVDEDNDETKADLSRSSQRKSRTAVDKCENGVLISNKSQNKNSLPVENLNTNLDLSLKRNKKNVSTDKELMLKENNKSTATNNPAVKKDNKFSGSNKSSWADCARTSNVHPSNKQEKPVKDTCVPANPIKNFIALNKAQLHRGSGKKTYTEIFLERKAKAEAKRRDELAKMLGVKIPANIEEEREFALNPVERLQNSDAAGDVQLNDGSISRAVKKKFVEPDGEGMGKEREEEGEWRQVSGNYEVSQVETKNSKSSREDLKKENCHIKSSKEDLENKSDTFDTEKEDNNINKLDEINDGLNMTYRSKSLTEIPSGSNEKISDKFKNKSSIPVPKLNFLKSKEKIDKTEHLTINKSASDTEIIKKITENEKIALEEIKLPSASNPMILESSQQEEQVVSDSPVPSTLSTGFISTIGSEGLKIPVLPSTPTSGEQVMETRNHVPFKQVGSEEKSEADLDDMKTEQTNRSKRKKKSGRQKSIVQKEEDSDISTSPKNKSNKDKSKKTNLLPPLKEDETNQDGKNNINNSNSNNNNNYKPYTLKDYRQLQLDIQLGGLGPNSDRNVLQEKLQKYQRQANYAQQVMERNRKLLEARIEKSKTTFAQVMQEASDPSKDTRQRGLDYAKNIRKPPGKLEKEENKDLTSVKSSTASKQVKLPPLKPANTDRWQAEGMAKGARLETVIEEEPAGIASPVKTRPFAMDSLMENVEKLRERHAKEREIVEQLFTSRNTPRKEVKEKSDDKQKRKSSKNK